MLMNLKIHKYVLTYKNSKRLSKLCIIIIHNLFFKIVNNYKYYRNYCEYHW